MRVQNVNADYYLAKPKYQKSNICFTSGNQMISKAEQIIPKAFDFDGVKRELNSRGIKVYEQIIDDASLFYYGLVLQVKNGTIARTLKTASSKADIPQAQQDFVRNIKKRSYIFNGKRYTIPDFEEQEILYLAPVFKFKQPKPKVPQKV